jgi:prolyl oligopeptidase
MILTTKASAAVAAGLIIAQSLMAQDDPYLWLEDVEGRRALEWAEQQNERSLEVLESHPLFDSIHARNLEILTSQDRIAYPTLMGGRIYNYWRDATHVRGIWRITDLESYRTPAPGWDVVLDVDRLAADENENWVWAGATCRYPDYERCIIGLSRGGADAAVRRELDLETREFVTDGFVLQESKSRVGWRDRDSVFLGLAVTDEQMTDSGYPRTVRIWNRGTPAEAAELVFEGTSSDVAVTGTRLWDGEDYYDLIVRSIGFFTRHYHWYRDGEAHRLHVQDDAEIAGIIAGQALVLLKSDWEVGGERYRQGSLLAAPVHSLLGDTPELAALFEPDERSAIEAVSTTQSTVIVNVLDNVVSALVRFTYDERGWRRHHLHVPELGAITVVTADDKSDRFFFNYAGFLTPNSLFEADASSDESRAIRSEPSWFDAAGMTVAQHEAKSRDGELIPYFVVMPRGYDANGVNPALLTAYGGFEVSRTPSYSGIVGSAWLEHGGVFVLANIRGGGEFGPRWHQAALKENRQRAYDDFIAVAEDLIARRITSPEHLGIQGGSNGGLLVGAAFTQRPELFNAVVCQVPLLDMRRYHRLLAGASWMAEYGDPDVPSEWAFISRYSPYQNVQPDVDYPQVFFTTSTRDDRVHPAHARKMVAKMLDQGHDVLYYENIEGGHGGAANLQQQAYVNALIYAYLHDRLGLERRRVEAQLDEG